MKRTIPTALLAASGCLLSGTANGQGFEAVQTLAGGELADFRDSTPDSNGAVIYFTAIGAAGAGVYRVSAAGGPPALVYSGNPFVNPVGIAISNDGGTLYVADPLAYAGPRRTGAIFSLAATGGRPQVVRGSEGLSPRGIDVDPAQALLYFTGRNPETRRGAVYRLAAGGAESAARVVENPLMNDPDGITVSRTGVLYLSDRGGRSEYGSVFRLDSAGLARVVDLMRPGTPAGVALSLDESVLLVSTLQPFRDRAQVLAVQLDTLETQTETRVIGENARAGGLHRARSSDVMSWADSEGGIYRVKR